MLAPVRRLWIQSRMKLKKMNRKTRKISTGDGRQDDPRCRCSPGLSVTELVAGRLAGPLGEQGECEVVTGSRVGVLRFARWGRCCSIRAGTSPADTGVTGMTGNSKSEARSPKRRPSVCISSLVEVIGGDSGPGPAVGGSTWRTTTRPALHLHALDPHPGVEHQPLGQGVHPPAVDLHRPGSAASGVTVTPEPDPSSGVPVSPRPPAGVQRRLSRPRSPSGPCLAAPDPLPTSRTDRQLAADRDADGQRRSTAADSLGGGAVQYSDHPDRPPRSAGARRRAGCRRSAGRTRPGHAAPARTRSGRQAMRRGTIPVHRRGYTSLTTIRVPSTSTTCTRAPAGMNPPSVTTSTYCVAELDGPGRPQDRHRRADRPEQAGRRGWPMPGRSGLGRRRSARPPAAVSIRRFAYGMLRQEPGERGTPRPCGRPMAARYWADPAAEAASHSSDRVAGILVERHQSRGPPSMQTDAEQPGRAEPGQDEHLEQDQHQPEEEHHPAEHGDLPAELRVRPEHQR